VATFFSVTAYNPLIVVAVLKAIAAAPPSIARATPQTPPPQPQTFLPRTPGASKPTNSPTPAPRFVAINHPAKTQPKVTATRHVTAKKQPKVTAPRHVKCAPLQNVSDAPLEKKLSSLLEESMNDPVAAQIRNERAQIVEAVVVERKAKTRAEVQREMRSVLAGMLGECEAMNDDSSGSESVESESAIMGKYFN
jgi:hypothetical protein